MSFKEMDTCDRYSLHERYKIKVSYMIKQFAYDFIIEMRNKDENNYSMKHLNDFCDEWVGNHIKPFKFDE